MSLVFAKPIAAGLLGPSSAIDNQLMRFDGVTGHLIQVCPGATCDDNGGFKFQNSSDSTTAYQWLDADGGTPILNIDTTNERVGFGTDEPEAGITITTADNRLLFKPGEGIVDAYTNMHVRCDNSLYLGDHATDEVVIGRDASHLIIILGPTTIGDGGTTDYAQFASDGDHTLAGTARINNSEWMSAQNFKVPATNPATMIHYGVGWALEFADEANNYEHAELRIAVPKDMDRSVQPVLILGWSCPTADDGNDSVQVRWELGYLWRAPNDPMDAAVEATVVNNFTASETEKGLVITQIQLAELGANDVCLSCELTRRSDHEDDTADGVAAHVAGACLYYTANRHGEVFSAISGTETEVGGGGVDTANKRRAASGFFLFLLGPVPDNDIDTADDRMHNAGFYPGL